jgi:DNA primase
MPDENQREFDDSLQLLNRDEQSERAIIRALLEFGLKPWDDEKRVADFMFGESIDQEMIDNKDLLTVFEQYRTWYHQGLEPTAKNFLYQEDQELSRLVVSIMEFPYELSPNWKDHYEGKISTREELYKEEVLSTLNYLKLRKIKRLIELNQKDWEKSKDAGQQEMFMQTHLHLKNMERELMGSLGTVIVK